MNRAARRAMARCKHQIGTKTDGTGTPYLRVCRLGCGFEEDLAGDEPASFRDALEGK